MARPIEPLGALCADAACCRCGVAGDWTGALGDADGRRADDGCHVVHGGVRPDADLWLDGCAQFCPRGVRHRRRLHRRHGAAAARRVDQRAFADSQSRRVAGGLGCRRRCQRRARLCLRARHHSTGLWCAAAPDPDHDRRSDRHRATGHRDLGAAGPAAAEACHAARQYFHRLVVDRNLSAVRAVCRSGGCAWRCIFS